MQLISIAIATASVYLIARYSPFNRIQKILIAFGYFSFYEYGIIARSYGLGVLFVIIFCVLMTAEHKNYLAIGLSIFLITQSNSIAVLLVPALIIYVLWNFLLSTSKENRSWSPLVLVGLISIVGLLLCYAQVRPPSDEVPVVGPKSTGIGYAIATVWESYAPIPQRIATFWGSNFVTRVNDLVLLSSSLIVAAVIFFSRNIKILATYIVGSAILISFFELKYLASLRHHGYLYILFFACVWLLFAEQKKYKTGKGLILYQQIIITLLISLQFIAGGVAVYQDINFPFSDAKTAANYIKSSNLESLPIVGYLDYNTSPVLGYLNKTAYYPQSARWGSFVIWDLRRQQPNTFNREIDVSVKIAHDKNSDVLLISPFQFNAYQAKKVKFIAKFNRSAAKDDEVYFLYLVPNR